MSVASEHHIENELIEQALEMALEVHRGQIDKAGKPYILHPLAVWSRVRHQSVEVQIVALLHDAVEDADGDPVALREDISSRFGLDVAEAIDALTRTKGEVYRRYIVRLSSDPIAVIVKKEDLAENMSPERIASLPVKERGILSRYKVASAFLSKIS